MPTTSAVRTSRPMTDTLSSTSFKPQPRCQGGCQCKPYARTSWPQAYARLLTRQGINEDLYVPVMRAARHADLVSSDTSTRGKPLYLELATQPAKCTRQSSQMTLVDGGEGSCEADVESDGGGQFVLLGQVQRAWETTPQLRSKLAKWCARMWIAEVSPASERSTWWVQCDLTVTLP